MSALPLPLLLLSLSLAVPQAATTGVRDAPHDSALAVASDPDSCSAGAHVAFDSGVLAGVRLVRRDAGLWAPGSRFELDLDAALLTGLDGYRLRLERHETLGRRGAWTWQAVLGSGVSLGVEREDRFVAWSGVLGAQLFWQWHAAEVGVRLAYLPTLVTRVWLSADARDHFGDRYPDQRDTRGPAAATLFGSGQRAQALVFGSWPVASRWRASAALGLQPGLLAGSDRFNLEAGQVPFLLQAGVERSF